MQKAADAALGPALIREFDDLQAALIACGMAVIGGQGQFPWDGREALPEPGPVWQVTRDGAPITSFPAQDSEGAGDVREKVLEWLRANESRPEADVGRQ